MKKALFVVAAAVLSCLITGSVIAGGIVPIEDFRYFLDPTSTSGGKNDVLRTDISRPTVVVDTLGTDLGLTAADNLNALSNGAADIATTLPPVIPTLRTSSVPEAGSITRPLARTNSIRSGLGDATHATKRKAVVSPMLNRIIRNSLLRFGGNRLAS